MAEVSKDPRPGSWPEVPFITTSGICPFRIPALASTLGFEIESYILSSPNQIHTADAYPTNTPSCKTPWTALTQSLSLAYQ